MIFERGNWICFHIGIQIYETPFFKWDNIIIWIINFYIFSILYYFLLLH